MTSALVALAWYAVLPPAGDAHRLPPLPVLSSGRVFNQRYQSQLQKRVGWESHRDGAVCRALAEARWLYEVWDCAEGAHPDWSCTPDAKKRYLRRLRLLLGREAYLRAELPPPVPLWRFHELR